MISNGSDQIEKFAKTGIIFIAVFFFFVTLYVLRDILAPFILAVFFWLLIDGFARVIDRYLTFIPYRVALILAILTVLAVIVLTAGLITNSVADFAENSGKYQEHIDQKIGIFYKTVFKQATAPTLSQLLSNVNFSQLSKTILDSLSSVSSNAILIIIYILFLFAAQSSFPKKLDAVFKDEESKMQARTITQRIRLSIERYVWVQTVISVIITILSYFTMQIVGLDNAPFWAFLIFILNYLPTIGSIIAVFIPTIFALIQFSDWRLIAVIAIGLSLWQFSIGNFIQPRMMGSSMNLSILVVLLGLALWGALWGGIGMFLSAPLTVMIMILLAQSSSTRWIAILLSANGDPNAGFVMESAIQKDIHKK